MKTARTASDPQFLSLLWEVADPGDGPPATFEAFLCKRHRQEIALQHPSARGTRRLGESCDLCEGRAPTPVPGQSPEAITVQQKPGRRRVNASGPGFP